MVTKAICKKCGSNKIKYYPGKGPHFAKAQCENGHFIKWATRLEVEKNGGFTVEQKALFS